MQRSDDESREPQFSGSFLTPPGEVNAFTPQPEPEREEDAESQSGLLRTGGRVWLRLPVHRPMFTIGILAILGVVYLAQELSQHSFDLEFAKVNRAIVRGEYWRLLTATMLHGNLLHFVFNAYGIYLFGQQVEAFFGRWRFLSIYILSGLAGSVASFAFSPVPSLGASGALFGLVGALGVYFYAHRRLLGSQGRAQLWNVLFIVGISLVFGLTQSMAIDNWGHIGGLLGGLAVGAALLPRYRPGREFGVDERLLEDRTPSWVPPAASLGLLALLSGLFWLALLAQRGTL